MTEFMPAVASDMPRLMTIVAEAQAYLKRSGVDQWQDGYPESGKLLSDIESGRLYKAVCDGESVGFCALFFGDAEPTYENIYDCAWRSEESYCTIHRMAVSARFRGTGAARFMFSQAEKLCRERALSYIRVDTHQDNIAMQTLLMSMGYEKCGIIFIESGAKRIAFDKLL